MNLRPLNHRNGNALLYEKPKLKKSNLLFKIFSALFTLSLLATQVNAQLRAGFSATPLSGCAPVVVNFTDLSTGNPTQWKWELGNGTTSILQNPSATYFNPGQYTVKLTVQNNAGRDSIIRVQYISIYAQPVVNFTASQTTGCFPLPVQFTDQSSAGSGTITSWEWDFGDGTTGNTQNPSHTYNSPGGHNVSLRVTNSQGCAKTFTRLQYINISEGVEADFSNSRSNSCTLPVNIIFQNLSQGTGNLSYTWNFGDGAISTQQNPGHSYNNPGSYTVTLIATNSFGCSDTITRSNAVIINPLQASFSAQDTVCINIPFTFTNTSAPTPFSSNWKFGDGTVSNAVNPVKVYTALGAFQVTLTVSSPGCADTLIKNIFVISKPGGSFSGNPRVSCRVPLAVNFTNTSSGAVSYQWLFGDGGTSSQANPTYTYTVPGIYDVTLISTNSAGCDDTLIMQQYILLTLPVTQINDIPQEGCAPFSWTFSSVTTSTEPVSMYQWNFGDGTTSTAANPTHIFPAGSFDIKLIVTTAGGCTDTAFVLNGIRAGNKPVANFRASPRDVCASTPVHFYDLTLDSVDRWLWDFGDGFSDAVQNPTHVYQDTGFFTVTLIVWDRGCPDTIRFTDYIHINAPIARFNTDYNCENPLYRIFTDQSIGADEWNWDFGDGTTSNLQNPTHLYVAPGLYTITLLVKNYRTGCEFRRTQIIRLINESADFMADSIICKKSIAIFSALASRGNINSYRWSFGDGTSGSGATTQHTYLNSGIYTVSLIITDIYGCKDTLVKPQYIRVNGPTADFAVSETRPCLRSAVNFTDSSLTDGIHPITTWTWNYGDGIIETLSSGPFQHIYTIPGIHTITLITTDSEGCSDTIVRPRLITISNPVSAFKTNDTLSCPGATINFTNNSTGLSLTYKWNFGDGTTSNVMAPNHTYAGDGIYTVSLYITDRYGCRDTLKRISYVKIISPVAAFNMSDSAGSCPPLIVNFINTSSNAVSVSWNFGDGTSSQVTNPSHFYNTPGTYIVKLKITGAGGCVSTKTSMITLKGPQGTFAYGALQGCKPLIVNFSATSRNRASFIWDFNDGTTISTTDSMISHTYTIPGNYVPRLILVDSGGCTVPVNGRDTVKINGATAAFTFSTVTICNSGSVDFLNTSLSNEMVTGYQWNFGDGGVSNLQNPSHIYNTNGIYYPTLHLTTISGCRDSARSLAPVKVVSSPDGIISQTANGCTPVTVTFNGNVATADTSALTWFWNFGNGNSSVLRNPDPQVYSTAGSYPVTLFMTNSSGCRDTVNSIVYAYAIPVISAGTDNFICEGSGKILTASGGSSYLWSPSTGLSCTNCATPVATPDYAITYKVTGTTINGCSNTDSVHIEVKYPFMLNSSPADTLCYGRSLKLSASGGYNYIWSPPAGLNNANIPNPIATPATTTNYRVIATDEFNCFTDTAYVPLTVFPVPTVNAGTDKTINVGQTLDLVPGISADVTDVSWSPTGSIFRSSYPSVGVKPRETTVYTVEVRNRGGCTAIDNLTVTVICNGANVFIPNTFSPNGDGNNDIFYPRGTGLFSIKAARIYSRWGEMVYEKTNFFANDKSSGWNGIYKGQKLNPDVYVYIIEVLCDNNTVMPLKGNIALLK